MRTKCERPLRSIPSGRLLYRLRADFSTIRLHAIYLLIAAFRAKPISHRFRSPYRREELVTSTVDFRRTGSSLAAEQAPAQCVLTICTDVPPRGGVRQNQEASERERVCESSRGSRSRSSCRWRLPAPRLPEAFRSRGIPVRTPRVTSSSTALRRDCIRAL